jgi:hypothetical protein
MQLTRKKFGFVALALVVLGGVAIAGGSEVANFTTPGTVTVGQNVAASVTVNQAPMSVTFSSNPPGLVNYTTTVNSTSATVSVPTNGSAGEGTYTLIATPTAGGTSKSKTVLAASGI